MADRISVDYLFVAVPDLLLEDAFLDYLHREGYITNAGLETIRRVRQSQSWVAMIKRKTRNKPLMGRLLAIAPEVINRKLIGLLEHLGKIDKEQAAVFRVWMGVVERSGGKAPKGTIQQVAHRARKMFGFGFVDDLLSLMVVTEQIEAKEAAFIRAELLAGRVTLETIAAVRNAKGWLDMLALTGSGLVDKRMLDAMRLAGLIDSRTALAFLTALSYGKAQWTVFEGAKKAEGLAARMAYMLTGSFSFEMLEFLKATGKLSSEQALLLQIGVSISQRFNRQMMEDLTDRKYRVIPGERPVVSYLRAGKETDSELLKMLADASKRASKEAEALSKRGRVVRAAEYQTRARALHQAMRQVWEGTGYLTIFGEKKVADAAISASELLQRRFTGHLDEGTRYMLERQARSGIDSYISRKENTLQLSRRVYGNLNLWTRKVDKEVNIGLLTGKSAKEIAKSVEKLINPNVMGGVKYASMRLGRTELANAFHLTTIRHTREMPWVRGYKWNKSSSHRHNDICDSYAEDDHDNLGPGVFKKANVPGKPHPQCLCYVTVTTMSDAEFLKAFNAGRFNQYLAMRAGEPTVVDTLKDKAFSQIGRTIGKAAGGVAVSQGIRLVDRMAVSQKGRVNPSFNPVHPAEDLAKMKSKGFFEKTIHVEAAADVGIEREASAKALKRLRKAQREDDLLTGRRKTFNALDRERFYAVRQGKEFDLNSYEEILSPDSGLQGGRPEVFARSMYGTRAYRKINENLRLAKGRVKEYDELFAEAKPLLEELNSIDPEDPTTWAQADKTIAKVGKAFGIKTVQGPYGLGFADDKDNSGLHYWDSIHNLTLDHGDGEDDWKSPFLKHSDIVRNLDGQMESTKGNRMTYRITGNDWFGLDRDLTANDAGRVFTDHGFVSTEGLPKYYGGQGNSELMLKTDRRPNRVKVYIPEGSKAMRLNDFEYEVLLSRGSTFQVMSVDPSDLEDFRNDVSVMLVKQKNLKTHRKEPTDEDMWDDLMGLF